MFHSLKMDKCYGSMNNTSYTRTLEDCYFSFPGIKLELPVQIKTVYTILWMCVSVCDEVCNK